MDQKSNAFLEKEPIGKLMGKYAVPCVISLLWRPFTTSWISCLSPTRTIWAPMATRPIRWFSR